MENLHLHIESLIFVASSPIKLSEIKHSLDATFEADINTEDIEKGIEQLVEKYQHDEFSIEIVNVDNGFRFLSKASFHLTVGNYLKHLNKKKLSKSALETLAIIAYKQPVGKSEIEQIRGVSCDYAVQKLLEKELVEIFGRSDGPGRPLLYGTGTKFMDYFGLKSIKDLPKLREFQPVENTIGEAAPIEEDVATEVNHANEEE